MNLLRVILYAVGLFLNGLTAIALLLASMACIVPPDKFILPALMALGFEWLVMANLVCVLMWLPSRRKSFSVISLIVLLCSLPSIDKTMSICGKPEKRSSCRQLTVMSYNTYALDESKKAKDNRVLQYIKECDCDIVCLQELRTDKKGRLITLQEVKDYLSYPYSYIDFKTYEGRLQFGIAVFSKYPLINKQTLRYESASNISDRCDVVVGGDTIRLLNNHLQSYSLTKDDMHWDASGERLRESTDKVGKKVRKAYRYRPAQAAVLAQEVSASPYPVLVCGDFNDVPASYVYNKVSAQLVDAFLENTSWQSGHTYAHHGIGVRIDYILHSPTLRATSFRIGEVDYSDHFPIFAQISW